MLGLVTMTTLSMILSLTHSLKGSQDHKICSHAHSLILSHILSASDSLHDSVCERVKESTVLRFHHIHDSGEHAHTTMGSTYPNGEDSLVLCNPATKQRLVGYFLWWWGIL